MTNRLLDWVAHHQFYLKTFLMIYALLVLQHTDSYYAIYMILGLISFAELCRMRNHVSDSSIISQGKSLRADASFNGISLFFALCISLANYRLMGAAHFNPVKFIFVTIGGYYICKYFLLFLKGLFFDFQWKLTLENSWSPKKTFGISFSLIVVVDVIFLLLGSYPGILTPDCVDQVHQIMTGVYSNHHPFWHTQLIRAFITLGMALFPNNLFAGIAVFSLFQIFLMSGIFSFMLMTLSQAKIGNKAVKVILAWIVLMPFNIFYSVTLWKNILFSGMVLLFATVLFRLIHQIGSKQFNYMLLFASGVLMSIWQSNGIIALAITMILLAISLRNKRKVLMGIGLSVIVVSVIMIGPVLHYLHVRPTEPNEMLSIPQQQISRVLHDGKRVSDKDIETLAHYADPQKMKSDYKPYISDPTKGIVHGDYWVSHKVDYFKTWAHIGVRYPQEYVKAWIDETRGYWNGGYKYWIWSKGINKMFYDVIDAPYEYKSNPLQRSFYKYGALFENNMLVVFISIGLHVWILVLLAVYTYKRRKQDWLIAVPALSVVLTLLISTPVFSEFRYAYSVFLTVPLMIVAAIYSK